MVEHTSVATHVGSRDASEDQAQALLRSLFVASTAEEEEAEVAESAAALFERTATAAAAAARGRGKGKGGRALGSKGGRGGGGKGGFDSSAASAASSVPSLSTWLAARAPAPRQPAADDSEGYEGEAHAASTDHRPLRGKAKAKVEEFEREEEAPAPMAETISWLQSAANDAAVMSGYSTPR